MFITFQFCNLAEWIRKREHFLKKKAAIETIFAHTSVQKRVYILFKVYTRISFLPHRKHIACQSWRPVSLMPFRIIKAVCSNNRRKYRNQICGKRQNSLLLQQVVCRVTTGLESGKRQYSLLLEQVVCRVTTGLEAVNMFFSKYCSMLYGKRLYMQIVMLMFMFMMLLFIISFKHASYLNNACKVRWLKRTVVLEVRKENRPLPLLNCIENRYIYENPRFANKMFQFRYDVCRNLVNPVLASNAWVAGRYECRTSCQVSLIFFRFLTNFGFSWQILVSAKIRF